LGLLYAWVWAPVEQIDTFPSSLRADFKDEYRALVARAYVADGDLGRAQARLALLGDDDPARAVSLQAQLTLGEGGSDSLARALGILAADLESGSSSDPEIPSSATAPGVTVTPSLTPTLTEAPGASLTPTKTTTPIASRTPTATQGAAFVAREFFLVCEEKYTIPLIMVYVFNAANQPVPGVEVQVTWEGGTDTFFTGLKPEFGLGYADFEMTPEVIYTLRLADGGEPVSGLATVECENDDGLRWWGSWRVNFTQP
jgi:hypothetical protein